MARQKSRSKRWAEAASDACEALSILREVQEEYEEWRDNMADSFEGTATQEKLDEVCDMDVEGALDMINEATEIDLPRGFGRD